MAMTSSNVDGSSLALGGGTGVVGVNTASVFLNTAGSGSAELVET